MAHPLPGCLNQQRARGTLRFPMAPLVQPHAHSRVVYVDLLRLLAIFQMVQGHTLDAVLDVAYRDSSVHAAWTWTRGLTSVAFLFAAGLSFHLSAVTRLETRGYDHAGAKRRATRALGLIALGYALRNPLFAWLSSADAIDGAWRAFLAVDILQCIGVSLLILELLAFVARRASVVVWGSAALFVLLAAAAPFTSQLQPTGGWGFALGYVTARGGSLFPVIPFGAYMFAGVAVGALVLPDGSRTHRPTTVLRLAALGMVLLVAGLATPIVVTPLDQVAVKLGAVMLIAAALALVSIRLPRLASPWSAIASESLIIYVVHVVLLYGAGVGLHHAIGRTLSLPPALLATVLMLVLSAAVAILFHKKKVLFRGQAQQTLATH